MELETLRWALHGTAAYRHVVEEEPLQKVLMLLDKLAAGDGAGAAEDYARLFYTPAERRRKNQSPGGSRGWDEANHAGTGSLLMPPW